MTTSPRWDPNPPPSYVARSARPAEKRRQRQPIFLLSNASVWHVGQSENYAAAPPWTIAVSVELPVTNATLNVIERGGRQLCDSLLVLPIVLRSTFC